MAKPLPTDVFLLRKIADELSAHIAGREHVATLRKIEEDRHEAYKQFGETDQRERYRSAWLAAEAARKSAESLPPMPLAEDFVNLPFAFTVTPQTPEQVREWFATCHELHAVGLQEIRDTHSRVVEAIDRASAPAFGAIVLNGMGKRVTVGGKSKAQINQAPYKALEELVKAGTDGMKREALELKVPSGPRALGELRDNDEDWAWAIIPPSKPGARDGWRINPDPGPREKV